MKIFGGVSGISGIYGKHKNVNKVDKTAGVASKKDVLSISSQAKDFQTVMKAVKDLPDIRKDKVDGLSEKYNSGNYDISGREIADKLLKSIVDKKV